LNTDQTSIIVTYIKSLGWEFFAFLFSCFTKNGVFVWNFQVDGQNLKKEKFKMERNVVCSVCGEFLGDPNGLDCCPICGKSIIDPSSSEESANK